MSKLISPPRHFVFERLKKAKAEGLTIKELRQKISRLKVSAISKALNILCTEKLVVKGFKRRKNNYIFFQNKYAKNVTREEEVRKFIPKKGIPSRELIAFFEDCGYKHTQAGWHKLELIKNGVIREEIGKSNIRKVYNV